MNPRKEPQPFEGLPLSEPSERVDRTIQQFAKRRVAKRDELARRHRLVNLALAAAALLVVAAVFWRSSNEGDDHGPETASLETGTPQEPGIEKPGLEGGGDGEKTSSRPVADSLDDLLPADRSSTRTLPSAVARLRREILRVLTMAQELPEDSEERRTIEDRASKQLLALDNLEVR